MLPSEPARWAVSVKVKKFKQNILDNVSITVVFQMFLKCKLLYAHHALKIPCSKFSWTTWNAFGKQVSSSGNSQLLLIFKRAVHIHFLIIQFYFITIFSKYKWLFYFTITQVIFRHLLVALAQMVACLPLVQQVRASKPTIVGLATSILSIHGRCLKLLWYSPNTLL